MRRLMVLLALVLAGCGSGTAEEPAQDDVATAAMDFAKCMRDRGFDIPDPTFDDQGRPSFGQMAGMVKDAGFDDARRACAEPLNEAMAAAGIEVEKPDRSEALLPFARCMREQGIDFPDPVPGEVLEIPKAMFHAPTWGPAVEACADTVPEEWQEILEPPAPQGQK